MHYCNGLASRLIVADFPTTHTYLLALELPISRWHIFLCPSIALLDKYWNINQFLIRYGFHPLLRDRLTLGRLTLPRKPRVYGEYVSHIFYRYSCQHDHFTTVHDTSQYRFSP